MRVASWAINRHEQAFSIPVKPRPEREKSPEAAFGDCYRSCANSVVRPKLIDLLARR